MSLMKVVCIGGILGVATFLAIRSSGAHESIHNINADVDYWIQLNRECRGSTDPAIVRKSCSQRLMQSKKLESFGLCQGKYNLGRFQDWYADTLVREKWIPCNYKKLVY